MTTGRSAAHDALFRDLLSVDFDGDKVDSWENATDIVEITAVRAGLKPAHLSGAGHRGITVQAQLESIANAHGLYTANTLPITPWRHRASRLPSELEAFLTERQARDKNADARILWIFADPSLEARLPAVVAGESSVAEVLGYPPCCVVETSELGLRVHEALYGKYWDMAGGHLATVADLISRDVEVAIDVPIAVHKYSSALPFAQFIPCSACRGETLSPAKARNDALAAFARELDPSFAARITTLAHRR